ncbi:hypothetical protein KFK09_020190 [Dendrobium nobile]|uniref:DUF7750 domain-containing protein n=1 Tax=Dendrobium nobile TaxID=94219 RepID=A0A8T3AT44_DENNO|nr:hypothetical protein KFK09_020190 [Dendrobium nobile]
MNLACFSPHLDRSCYLIPCRFPTITRHDLRRRPRRKALELRCQFGLEGLFSTVSSVPPLDLLAPVFGFASAAAAAYLQRSLRQPLGEWILFTSPTPFNRCVLLRCPSVLFEDDGELLNGVNDRLVREDRHYVNLSRGGVPFKDEGDAGFEKDLKFQRVCLRTDDGGVISMDWPDYLDLEREQGLDTAVLIIPGTPEGSMDKKVKLFVRDVVKHGCFPIVMNPRGSAGSALTTARLFTAADSDDVCTAVQFVNGIRPWATLMGIGWGYGANMLTRYLAESRETTPVTAAVCIDTPFDLEESTKPSSHQAALNEKLTNGLKEILRANKELFQGKTKGFDVAKALSATSIREFDGAVSMISHGFDSLEEFYRASSTRQSIDNLKIPILFMQSDDGTVPLFSIPRNSIAENPFTSLLLCSCSHSTINRGDQSALLWSQQLAIEWLSAVELALLKGRHPLLNDVDITIKPSKAPTFGVIERPASARSKIHGSSDSSQVLLKHNHGNMDSFMKLTRSDTGNGFLVYPLNTEVNGDGGALYDNALGHRKSGSKFYEMQRDDEVGIEDGKNEKPETSMDISTEGVANAISSEGGQVTQTATVIMNMLDVTMPGTLDNEQKKKVLGAMEQGETFMKALHGAVPEDVRGKITTAVAEIMQSQGANLNLEAGKRIGWIPNVTSELKSKIEGKIKGSSLKDLGYDDGSLEQIKVGKSNGIGSEGNLGPSQEKGARPSNGNGSEGNLGPSQEKGARPSSSNESEGNLGPSQEKGARPPNSNGSEGNFGPSQEKSARSSGSIEAGVEMEDKVNQPDKSDQVGGGANDESSGQDEVIEKSDAFDKNSYQHLVHGDDMNNKKNEAVDSSPQPSSTNFDDSSSAGSSLHQMPGEKGSEKYSSSKPTILNSTNVEDSSSSGSSVHQMPGEENGNPKNGENPTQDGASQNAEYSSKSEEPSPQPSSSKSNSISVSQALNALTEFDDSTQMAVNSVFGVIENMIDQLEKSNKEGDDEVKKSVDQRSTKGFNDDSLINGEKYNKFFYINNGSGIEPDLSQAASQLENTSSETGIESYEDVNDKLGYSKLNFSSAPLLDKCIKQSENDNEASHFSSTNLTKDGDPMDLTLDVAMKRYWLSPYAPYLHRCFTPLPSQSSLDLEKATDLFLDPEEGQWKMIDQPSNSTITTGPNGKDQNVYFASGRRDVAAVEPSLILVDGEYSKFNSDLFQEDDYTSDNEHEDSMKEKLFSLIKNALLDNLKVEVHRRIRIPDSEELNSLLACDLENFTEKVSRAVVSYSDLNTFKENIGATLMKFGTVELQQTVEIILSALQDASHLRKVLPSGVIVGSSLASLRTYLQLVALHDYAKKRTYEPVNKWQRSHGFENYIIDELSATKKIEKVDNDHHLVSNKPISQGHVKLDTVVSTKGCIMVGAVTTALGASALLATNCEKKPDKEDDTKETPDYSIRSLFSGDEFMQEKSQNNLVSSLAEKAMSVAAPVMPTKGDGELDHERLVAVLAELGQKGGILRLVGKVALLWGGIRGAMSLTDKLITFLHIAERPLFQRVVGFVCMVLVLWSPVVIPLLPTLVQSWTTHHPNRIAEFTCIVGFYIAAMILVVLWGKRIRGYDNPIEQYGLDLTSVPRVFDFLNGLVGGIMIVSCIHSVNALLGFVSFASTTVLPSSSSGAIVLLRVYGSLLLLTFQGIVSATGISVVEELLFRSWLAEEIAVEMGYYRAIMISGIVFALIQRSLSSVPGFLLLSIFLFGIKERAHGKLAAPVGIRTGLMAANFVIQNGNFLSYRAKTPPWLASPHPWHPFDGAVGLSLCAILAIYFFPKPAHKISRPIRE